MFLDPSARPPPNPIFGFRNKNCETTKANSLLAGKLTKTSVAGDVSASRFEWSVEVSAVSLLLDKLYLRGM